MIYSLTGFTTIILLVFSQFYNLLILLPSNIFHRTVLLELSHILKMITISKKNCRKSFEFVPQKTYVE